MKIYQKRLVKYPCFFLEPKSWIKVHFFLALPRWIRHRLIERSARRSLMERLPKIRD